MLDEIYEGLKNEACKGFLDKSLVFGEGNRNSPIIMMIGEAPGGDEEREGRPFVGKAGRNLNEFLEIMELNREDIFISNVVKIRPTLVNPKTNRTKNRTPNKSEIDFFKPYLFKEIDIINPKIIVTLGNVPLQTILKRKIVIGSCHGEVLEEEGRKVFPLYHPAAVIYNQGLRSTYLRDIDFLKNFVEKSFKI